MSYDVRSDHLESEDVTTVIMCCSSVLDMQDGVFLMYIFGGCSDSVTVDGGVHAVKGVKMEIGVAVSQGKNTL